MTSLVDTNYSVIMAVYAKDKPEWLALAFDSLLTQMIISNDIVVIIDGPIGSELEAVLAAYNKHAFITLVRLEKNQGLGNALNVGIKHAKNELIGRMDADDIAVPNRFELQLAAFEKNPELGILGGQIAEFIDNPEEIVAYRKVPTDNAAIKAFSRRRSPFNHPTVMYKKSVIEKLGGYDVSAIRIEDYDLWLRAIHSDVEVGNLDEVLLNYRSNEDAMKRRKTFGSLKNHIRARFRFHSMKYISTGDLAYGVTSQLILFIIPTTLADKIFKQLVRGV